VTPAHSDGERWERGGHRGGRVRGATRGVRKFPNATITHAQYPTHAAADEQSHHEGEDNIEEETYMADDPDPDAPEEREKFYQEVCVGCSASAKPGAAYCSQLVKTREVERKKAITEGKMDDPLVPKRLEDAITLVGTCMDMCPRFERYRREKENNLFEWETVGHN